MTLTTELDFRVKRASSQGSHTSGNGVKKKRRQKTPLAAPPPCEDSAVVELRPGSLITAQQLGKVFGLTQEQAKSVSNALHAARPEILHCPICHVYVSIGEKGLLIAYQDSNGDKQVRLVHGWHTHMDREGIKAFLIYNNESFARAKEMEVYKETLLGPMLETPPSIHTSEGNGGRRARGRPARGSIRRTLTAAHPYRRRKVH